MTYILAFLVFGCFVFALSIAALVIYGSRPRRPSRHEIADWTEQAYQAPTATHERRE